MAIQAGKHVFSEKPIAKDVATAIDLIRWYRSQTGPDRKILWAVGENWRWMDKYKKTAAEVGLHGALDSFRVKVHSMIKPDSKYHSKIEPLLAWAKLIITTSQKRNGAEIPTTKADSS